MCSALISRLICQKCSRREGTAVMHSGPCPTQQARHLVNSEALKCWYGARGRSA